MMEYIQERNAGALYDLFTKPTETSWPGELPPPR
jgi:hypothetical protein